MTVVYPPRAGIDILLFGKAGVTEMRMRVDEPRHDRKAGGVYGPDLRAVHIIFRLRNEAENILAGNARTD